MGFYKRDATDAARLAAAEKELQDAIDKERGGVNEIPTDPKAPSTPGPDGHDWKKRFGDSQRYITQLQTNHKAEMETLKKQLDEQADQIKSMVRAQSPAKLPQTVADVEQMKAENPAGYAAIMAIATQVAETLVADEVAKVRRDVDEVKNFRRQTEEEAAFIALQRLHPDLDLLHLFDNDPQFEAWIGSKSKRTQDAVMNNKTDVEAASDVITMYKLEVLSKSKTPARKDNTREGFVDVAPKGQVNIPQADPSMGWDFTESELEEMDRKDPRWFERNADKILKAMNEGRVLLDKTDPVGSQRRVAALGVM